MPAVPAPYPPELLQPDPLAVAGRSDVKGAGEIEILQNNPAAGDTIKRASTGYWINAPAEPGALGLASMLGNLVQANNTGSPARTNIIQANTASALKDEAAALITKEALFVPIPVVVGDVFKTVTVLVGATAANEPTHSWAALYSGELTASEGTIIGEQSVDGKTAAIAAKKPFAFTLPNAVTITAAMAPFGFIYASVSVTATTAVPSLIGVTGAAAVQEALAAVTNAPRQPAKFSVSGTEAVAKSPTGALTSVTTYPIVILS